MASVRADPFDYSEWRTVLYLNTMLEAVKLEDIKVSNEILCIEYQTPTSQHELAIWTPACPTVVVLGDVSLWYCNGGGERGKQNVESGGMDTIQTDDFSHIGLMY